MNLKPMAGFNSGSATDELLQTLLEVSLTGVILFKPVYQAEQGQLTEEGQIIDLSYLYLNGAAQRMLALEEQPKESFLTLYPHALETGIFAFYRDTFLSKKAGHLEVNYSHDGLDNYFLLSAKRSGDLLLVSFSDTAEQDRTPVEVALRESRDSERNALAQEQVVRLQLHTILMQAPAMICIFEGPMHTFKLVNAPYQALVGNRSLLGKPIREAMPELSGQPIFALLDSVYQTGEPFYAQEMLVQLDHGNTGKLGHNYYNFSYQAMRNRAGEIEGIMVFAYSVTPQVEAREQIAQSKRELQGINEQLAASNEELQASGEELQSANEELHHSQKKLLSLTEELEARVAERTRELQDTMQAQLAERETFYQVFEQTPAAICIQRGPEHRYSYVNPAYQALFPDRQFVGRSVAEALPETVPQGFVDLLDTVYQSGETFFGNELPVTLTHPDGSPSRTIYFDFTYQAYKENGQITGISTFACDVTEQVLARKEADRQRELLHSLFMEVPAPIVILDGPGLTFGLVNPAYQQIFPGRELFGKPLLEALPEVAGTSIMEILYGVYESGETFVAEEMPLMLARHEGGALEEIFFTFTYQARRNDKGRVDGVMAFAYEVTHQVKARMVVVESEKQAQALAKELASANEELAAANEEIESTNEELAESNRQLLRSNVDLKRVNVDLDNFIYTASHDLKAPISNIEALLSALLRNLSSESLSSDRVQRITTLMEESIERFKRTIANLTEVVKLQKDNNGEMVSVDLKGVIREVSLDLEPLIRETQASLHVAIEDCQRVYFSEKNLRSVVYNLLSNALKYRSSARTPSITITCQTSADYQVLTVSDNGLGMESGRVSQLFTMFKRFHDHVEGTGIGLYMVKKMVENAGGKIEAESRPNKGSTFKVYFPL